MDRIVNVKDIVTAVGSSVALAALGWLWLRFSRRGRSFWGNLGTVTLPIPEGAAGPIVGEVKGVRAVAVLAAIGFVFALAVTTAFVASRLARSNQVAFWTPSEKTVVPSVQIYPRMKWAANPDNGTIDKRADNFAENLEKKPEVIGFRRYEVRGKGEAPLTWGYWWVATLSYNYTYEELFQDFRTIWPCADHIYYEKDGVGRYFDFPNPPAKELGCDKP